MTDHYVLVVLGTKAQYIKTAPILKEMDRSGMVYRLVLTGQHSETFDQLERAFGLRPAEDNLVPGVEASTHMTFIQWALRFWSSALRRVLSRRWRGAKAGLVHGDTASTLFAAIALRLAGVPVVHVEAGLRSPKLLEPFPEELVRRAVSRLTHLHLAPDAVAVHNLVRVPGTVLDTRGNTLRDALQLALREVETLPVYGGEGGYAVVSMHRAENLGNAGQLANIIDAVVTVAGILPVKFVLHPATRERLRATPLWERLVQTSNIELLERMDYPAFVRFLMGARFLMTDGGSNQEEAAMLGLPTLLLRRATERGDGLGDCVRISNLDESLIVAFAKEYASFTWKVRTPRADSPSARIVEALRVFCS